MDKDPAVTLTGQATADPARDGPLTPDLVTGARTGDKRAWDALVEPYAPLIWSICGKYPLGHAGAQDVGQSAWLRLEDQLDKIRDPAALPGWLATTTRRECGRVLGTARRLRAPVYALDIENLPDGQAGPADRDCSRPSATRRCARRSPACRQTASN
jgi:DNA-directed RNA polymerase specialized sigma24 family protein